MNELESQKFVESTELLKEIKSLIGQKKVEITLDGSVVCCGYNSSGHLDDYLHIQIENFLNVIDDLKHIGDPEILEIFIKKSAQSLSKILIHKVTVAKNKNFTQGVIEATNKFRDVQINAKNYLIKSLQKDKLYKFRGMQMTWMGSSKQLVELFNVLYEKGWIKKGTHRLGDYLPIIETFNIIQEETVMPINEKSFATAWKAYHDTIHNSDKYDKKFSSIEKNPRNYPRKK